jgi:glycosyltransferase involved in cell wall biosynthesis
LRFEIKARTPGSVELSIISCMNRILYIQYTNPGAYPPLQHSTRILAESGWDVLVLGNGAAGADNLDFPVHGNITVRRMPFCHPGLLQKLHFLSFCAWIFLTALFWRPKWVYASDPLSCPAALIVSLIPGVRLLYHEHDSPQRGPNAGAFDALIARVRGLVARKAALCVLPNAARLQRFQSELGPLRAVSCVWNCPGLYETAIPYRELPQTPLWVLYHGSIVPDRLPLAVAGALALLPDIVRLRVVGYETIGSRGHIAALKSHAQRLGVGEERLEFLPPIPRAQLLEITKISDIGLALIPSRSSDGNFISMTGASNKVFDYLACGLPVVVSDLPDWREMFVEPGYGLPCDPASPESLAAAIRRFVENPVQMRAMGEAGRRRILDEWNYDKLFQPVLRHLETAA